MVDSILCTIQFKGHLSAQWCDWLGGLTIENQPNGEALLSGTLPDQAALFGVLGQVRDLGLTILYLCCTKSDRTEVPEHGGNDVWPSSTARQAR